MLNKIIKRVKEPSSYAGLAAILVGVNELFKVKELEPVIDATIAAGDAVAATGSPVMALAALIAGILAMFMPEKGEK